MFEAYIVTNSVNAKRYIGITSVGTDARWRLHIRDHKKSNVLLYLAMRKYGLDAFSVQHIASARSWVDAQEIERRLIAQEGTYCEFGTGYNMTLGGDGAYGYKRTDEDKRKKSIAKLGNQYGRGHKRSDDHIAAIRAAHIGKVITPEHRARLRECAIGRSPSEATRGKLRAAILGVKRGYSDAMRAQIERLARSNTGSKASAETKAKLSASLKGNPKVIANLARLRALRLAPDSRQADLFAGAA